MRRTNAERLMASFLLLMLFTYSLRALALRCMCDYPFSDLCSDNSCEVNNNFHPVHCDVFVAVYNNNSSIIAVRHHCINDFLLHECTTDPYISADGTYTTYYACCNDDDYCNKCIIPKELPELAYRMMGSWLDPDCNFIVPQPSPPSLSPPNTLQPSLASVTPEHADPECGDCSTPNLIIVSTVISSLLFMTAIALWVTVGICFWKRRRKQKQPSLITS